MNRRVVLIGIVTIAAVVACIFGVSHCRGTGSAPDGTTPLFDLLRENGYNGSEVEWYDSLSDEQKAAIDIAYEADESSGYKGTKEKWIADCLFAYVDHSDDIVVVLPDGDTFTISADSVADDEGRSSNGNSGALTNDASGGDSSEPGSAEPDAAVHSGGNDFGALLVVDSVHAHAGDADVAIPVRVEGNPGILGMTISVSYDESAMTLKRAENGGAFKDALSLTHSQSLGSGCLFTWDGIDLSPGDIKDGTVLTLYFDVSKDAALGAHVVAVRSGQPAFDMDLREVALSTQDGNVIVE